MISTASFSILKEEQDDEVYLTTVEAGEEDEATRKKKLSNSKCRLIAAGVVFFLLFGGFVSFVYYDVHSVTIPIRVITLSGRHPASRYGPEVRELSEQIYERRIAVYDQVKGHHGGKNNITLKMTGYTTFIHDGNITIDSISFSILDYYGKKKVGQGEYLSAEVESRISSTAVDKVGRVHLTAIKIDADATFVDKEHNDYGKCSSKLESSSVQLRFVVTVIAKTGETNIFGN
ncbi:hypothetical protein PFISCL1PPCAC_25725, partial [Pristionchus fissidentatus]